MSSGTGPHLWVSRSRATAARSPSLPAAAGAGRPGGRRREQPADGRTIDILLVEDNPGDVVLTREGLRGRGKIHTRLTVAPPPARSAGPCGRQRRFAAAARPT